MKSHVTVIFILLEICQCCSDSEISGARLNNHVVLGRKSSLSRTGPTCQPITLPLTAWQWATVDSSHRGHSTISWKVRHLIVLKLFFNKWHTHYPGTCMGLFILAWCNPIYCIPPNTGSHGMCQKGVSNTVSKSLPNTHHHSSSTRIRIGKCMWMLCSHSNIYIWVVYGKGSKNRDPKNMHQDEIGVCALSWKVSAITLREESLLFTSCISARILQPEMTSSWLTIANQITKFLIQSNS